MLLSSCTIMRPLSATEAISPAIRRTTDLLARPFRLGTFLKIAFIACLAEFGGVNLNFNSSLGRGNGHTLPPAVLAFLIAFAVGIAVAGLVIGLIFLYIGSRLELVLVEMIATRQKIAGPLWRKFGSPTWRWLGLRVVYYVAIFVVVIAIAVPIGLYFGITFRHGFHHPVFSITSIILLVMAALFVLLVFAIVYMLLRDFALPSFAFENVPLLEGVRRVCRLVAAEPGPVALFLFLQMLLVFVAAIGAEMAIAFVLLITAIPFVLVGVALYFGLHSGGPGGMAVLIAAAVVGGLIYIVWAFCVGAAGIGPVYLFSHAYALYFLGGRYPLLGDLLDSSEPPPAYPYAGFAPSGWPPPQVTMPPPPFAG